MAKKLKFFCSRCETKLIEERPFCKACGSPTQWASHDEKVEWELQQYEAARRDGAHADFDRLVSATPPVRRNGRTVTKPAAAPAAEQVVSVREFREQRSGDVAVVRRPAAELPPFPAQNESAVLMKVMRLLNARISELEARVAELEGERAPHRRAAERR